MPSSLSWRTRLRTWAVSAGPSAAVGSSMIRILALKYTARAIATVETTEGAAFGAGLLAGVGAGWWATVDAATDAIVRVTPVAAPGPEAARYAERHAVYRELYPALRETFPRL